MLIRWAIVFLIVALIAALFGFTGIAGESIWFAKILFFIFLVVFIISLLIGLLTGKRTSVP